MDLDEALVRRKRERRNAPRGSPDKRHSGNAFRVEREAPFFIAEQPRCSVQAKV